jgi:tyrosyl-tRNA synthetase
MQASVTEQITALRRGADDIITEAELEAKLARGKPLRVKLGIDPTAPDVHLGWAVVLRKLRQFQDFGHTACLIVGDFTAMIGDPTGKSKTRRQLSREEVMGYVERLKPQLFRILDPDRTQVYYNADWLGRMTFAEVIQLASRYTVARILEREDFANRLANNLPLGMHEILYPLCQGYDSVAIEADVELGGSDQRFNNLVGRDLQREYGQEPQVVFLMPLLIGLDGKEKMSQSLGNYIGISEPPDQMFGKVMSLPDELMTHYFVLCTDVPLRGGRGVGARLARRAGQPARCEATLGAGDCRAVPLARRRRARRRGVCAHLFAAPSTHRRARSGDPAAPDPRGRHGHAGGADRRESATRRATRRRAGSSKAAAWSWTASASASRRRSILPTTCAGDCCAWASTASHGCAKLYLTHSVSTL